jgi:hypothetical protein
MCGGIILPPPCGKKGETKFGLTIGDRVMIVNDAHFGSWFGHVRSFQDKLVAVDLDEPPPGERPNGQWFKPESVVAAPKK